MKESLHSRIIQFSKEIGFNLVGFSPAIPLEIETQRLMRWLHDGKQATMSYMERNIDKRRNVKELFPDAKSVISLGLNYYSDGRHINSQGRGKISRYAWGKDYHLVIWDKLEDLIERIKSIEPDFSAISYVDTGPVMDKVWAVNSGLGWMGKNTNVINPDSGSWFFIANIICNSDFPKDKAISDHCGTCTACIDACPTNALQPYDLDARKCISFLTIENRGEISREFSGKMDNWLFGCDVCQDVCPWNKAFVEETSVTDFNPPTGTKSLALDEVLEMTPEKFKASFSESPILRAKLSGLKRNASFLKSDVD
jgi:epoxyqueuosine reductase